jgi:hypothetical protein
VAFVPLPILDGLFSEPTPALPEREGEEYRMYFVDGAAVNKIPKNILPPPSFRKGAGGMVIFI